MTDMAEATRHGSHAHWAWGSATPERLALMEIVVHGIEREIAGKDVVDLGPGDGSITKILAKHARKVYAVDSDRELNSLLAKNCADIKNIVPVPSDSRRMALDDSSVDVVFSSSSFHDLPEGYEREIARVLRDGGTTIVFDWKRVRTEFGPPMQIRLDAKTVEKRFAAVGLIKIMEKGYGTHYLLVFRKPKIANA